MDTILSNIWVIVFSLSGLFFGAYASYYFSIVAQVGDLKEIRNHKIKMMIKHLMDDRKTDNIDIFFLIDDLNKDDKVWLLEIDEDDNLSKYANWVLIITTTLTITYFFFRSIIIKQNAKTEFTIIDLTFIAAYMFSLAWSCYSVYWEYVYYKPFLNHQKHMNKDINEAYKVVCKS